jgi:hypothetical protein
MKSVFRYVLLLSVVIIPLFFLYKEEDQFPILIGAFLGTTLTYWIAVLVIKIRQKARKRLDD